MPTSARRKLDGIVSAVVYLPKSPLTATQVSASSNEQQPLFWVLSAALAALRAAIKDKVSLPHWPDLSV